MEEASKVGSKGTGGKRGQVGWLNDEPASRKQLTLAVFGDQSSTMVEDWQQ